LLPPTTAPSNPYPFWQWLASTGGTSPASATVYSDNHGEAVVALSTGIATMVPVPTSGVCPAGYSAATSPTGVTTGCFLSLTTGAVAAFPGVAAATKAFSAGNPGCISTSVGASGVTVGTSTATIGANGPTSGNVICINSLGGIEFGTGAALASTSVQAVADYPYTRGEHPPVASATLTKVWTSAFNKSISVTSTGAAPGGVGVNNYLVTVNAVDICNNPLVGEPVSVYVLGPAGAAVLAPVSVGQFYSGTGTSANVTVGAAGSATFSLEVLSSALGSSSLLVKVVFPLEGIERFATVVTGTPVSGATAPVSYAPGWQQVGGPAGSNFSVAEALYSWDATGQAYTAATAGTISSAAPSCTGYWAFFASAMSLSLPQSSNAGDTATCNLAPGWNLVGNPFSSPAQLPSGTTGYHWNGTSYDAVGQIPLGGSVWLYNSGSAATTVTLTAT
jgi:hypothetical protein